MMTVIDRVASPFTRLRRGDDYLSFWNFVGVTMLAYLAVLVVVGGMGFGILVLISAVGGLGWLGTVGGAIVGVALGVIATIPAMIVSARVMP